METPQWRGAITGGIWQGVTLIATDDIYVQDVFIEPKIADNTATFHVQLMRTGDEAASSHIELIVRSERHPDQVVARFCKALDLQPGPSSHCWTIDIPHAVYWSPETPYLYRAEVNVTVAAAVSDRWNGRFGMRSFTIRDNKFYLNGDPIYLKATFFEGLYPVKLAYPDNREMAIREIQLAKDAGFNMIRPWRKPPPPMWLDLADEMGVMTVGSMAIECMDYPVESARLPAWVENEVRQSILRDRNRACVVQWELFNELKRPVLKRMLRPMSVLARQLDPTRLVLDESGGWAQGARMYLPYEFEPIHFNDIHNYPGPQINDEVYQKLNLTGAMTHEQMRQLGLRGGLPGRNVVPGLMTYFSELGYGSLPNLVDNNERFAEFGNPKAPATRYHRRLADQTTRALQASGLDSVYPDLATFCLDQQHLHGEANKRMIEAVRCNPHVAGYCIHALTAGDWIMGAGLLDLWRNPKTYAYQGTQAASQPRIISIRIHPRNVYAERGARMEITGVNELAETLGKLTVEVVAADGEIVYTKTAPVTMACGITPLYEDKLDTKSLDGSYTLRATVTSADGLQSAAGDYNFDVFSASRLAVPAQRIAVLDPSDTLKPFLRRVKIPYTVFDAKTTGDLPVFVSRTEARTPEERQLFKRLAGFIRTGGTAVYLQGGGPRAPWGRGGKASSLLPFDAFIKQSIGNWNCVVHVVRNHPIFRGLPVNSLMGPVYENIWAQTTLVSIGGETIAGSIAYDWFPDYDLAKRHYYGPGDAWWGGDVVLVPVGHGRCILSQLRLLENLGRDPAADKILYNLIEFAAAR